MNDMKAPDAIRHRPARVVFAVLLFSAASMLTAWTALA